MFAFNSLILFYAFTFKFIHSLNGHSYIDPGFTRLEYNSATSILQPYSSKNISQCSFDNKFRCFANTIQLPICQREIKDNFDAVGKKYLKQSHRNYANHISPYLYGCLVKKFSETEHEKRYLWVLDGLKTKKKQQPKRLYPKCYELLQENCDQCQPSFPYYVLDEMIRNCTDVAFRHANISSVSKQNISPINELEKLSMQKIGFIATSKAAQNLTFNDLENMKFVAARNPEVATFLCYPNLLLEMSLNFTDSFHKWFTLEEYEAVRNLLKENQYFRWFICSGIFAISSTTDLVCFPSNYKNCGDIFRYLPEADIYASLRECRKIAKVEDLHHSAICN